MGPDPPPPPPPPIGAHAAWPCVHYACAATAWSVTKQRRFTAGLNTREGEPPAKHGRQDTENDCRSCERLFGYLRLYLTVKFVRRFRASLESPPAPTPPLAANWPAPNALAPPKFCSRSAPVTIQEKENRRYKHYYD